MNYQLLIESYSFGTSLSEQEIELLSLELETQIMNINISTEFGCFKSAPTHICEGLNLKKNTYFLCFCSIPLWVLFEYVLYFKMIENYKGWDITLNWDNKYYLERDTTKSNFSNQKEKWIGVHLNGKKIYGSSLKEIRHIIDYPSLHAK